VHYAGEMVMMPENKNQRQIYIVVSQTGTWLSRILKRFTEAEYNHVSLSKIHYYPTNHYYCSSFVRDVLVHFQLIGLDEMMEIAQPIHFVELFEEKKVYSGKLQMYHT